MEPDLTPEEVKKLADAYNEMRARSIRGERKVIQLCDSKHGLLALCDDGSLWRCPSATNTRWEKIAGPPGAKQGGHPPMLPPSV